MSLRFVDETYVKVAGVWRYVYRAVDQHGQVIDVMVSETRDIAAARKFFTRAVRDHGRPRQVTTDLAGPPPRCSASSTTYCPRRSTTPPSTRTTVPSPTTAGSKRGSARCAD